MFWLSLWKGINNSTKIVSAFFRNLFTSHPTSKSFELFSSAFRQIMSTGLFANDVVQLLSNLKFRETQIHWKKLNTAWKSLYTKKLHYKTWKCAKQDLQQVSLECHSSNVHFTACYSMHEPSWHREMLSTFLFRLKFEYPSGRNLKKSSWSGSFSPSFSLEASEKHRWLW